MSCTSRPILSRWRTTLSSSSAARRRRLRSSPILAKMIVGVAQALPRMVHMASAVGVSMRAAQSAQALAATTTGRPVRAGVVNRMKAYRNGR